MLPGGTHSNFHARNNDITLCMKQGRGSRIWDIDDNEYLDLFGKYGACILGHHHAELDESLHRAVDHITVTELAETTYKVCQLLKEWFPHGDMIRMGLSGNEVIQNAFRLARGYTGKQKIIRFIGHFHGTADDVLGGWNHSIDTVDRSKLENQAFETEGRRENSFQSVIILPWNNVKLLEETMQRYSNSIAAIIMEPVMCNGGGILADNTFFAKVRKLCSENNVVFILDELITGIRSGPGGFQKEAGIVPDLTIVGKSIANGVLPLSCIIGKKEIMNLYTESGLYLVVHITVIS